MKNLLLVISLFISIHASSQDINGTWVWAEQDNSIQKVRITYIPSEDAIEWWIYQDSPGNFYFPRKVKMERVD